MSRTGMNREPCRFPAVLTGRGHRNSTRAVEHSDVLRTGTVRGPSEFDARVFFDLRASIFFRISIPLCGRFRFSSASPRSSSDAVAKQVPEKEEIVLEVA